MSIASELDLIRSLGKIIAPGNSRLEVAIGDDAAVLRDAEDSRILSCDTFAEGVDFKLAYFTPEQVGAKAIEASASDILAMGGRPSCALVSLGFPKGTSLEILTGIYEGIGRACARLSMEVAGGDITVLPSDLLLSVTVSGRIGKSGRIIERRGATSGDRLCVSGALGGSAAGLRVLLAGDERFPLATKRHREPQCRIDLVDSISAVATSMIDVSDGLASELHHLAVASGCGMRLEKYRIPLAAEVSEVAKSYRDDPIDYAMFGGEDFELLFTIREGSALPMGCREIGVVDTACSVIMIEEHRETSIPDRGYDHLKE